MNLETGVRPTPLAGVATRSKLKYDKKSVYLFDTVGAAALHVHK